MSLALAPTYFLKLIEGVGKKGIAAMPPKQHVDLKFYATLPVEEDPNYENGFQCDYCQRDFDVGPFFHCRASGTDCCLECAGDPGTPAKRFLKASELLASQQRASRTPSVKKKEPSRVAATTRSVVKVEDDQPSAAPSHISQLPVTLLFFPPTAAFVAAERTAQQEPASSVVKRGGSTATAGATFPLLGYCCGSKSVFGVVLSDGCNIVVVPSASIAWVVHPAPSAAADALAATTRRGKRGRGDRAKPIAHDRVDRLTLAAVDAQFPWILSCFGARSWKRAEAESGGVATPPLHNKYERPPAYNARGGATDVPLYVRWCSLVPELEMTGARGLPQGSLSGRIAFLLSDGAAQLIDFSGGINVIVRAEDAVSAGSRRHADDEVAPPAMAALADLVASLA